MKRFYSICVAVLTLVAFTQPGVSQATSEPCPPDPSQPNATVVMCRLESPRGLAFGPEGALYVAEAGRGGANLENPEDGFCCFTGPLGAVLSYGRTGAVSRLWRGHQEQIATGLPSIAMANGNRGIGPHDISFLGRGGAYVTIGLEDDPARRDTLAAQHPEFPELAGRGHLVHVAASGEWRFIADITAYETANNPDGRLNDDGTPFYDSNPYGILAEPGGRVVTDAGGNSLLRVDASGDISLLAVFHSRGTNPPRPSFAPERLPPLPPFDVFTDSVPTSVVVGPDGAYYVGELTGVPFTDTRANVYRVVPSESPQLFLIGDACLTGFKMIIDMAFDGGRNLYVLQHATGAVQQPFPGVLIKVVPDKSQTDICAQYQAGTRTTAVTGLTRPTSVVVGPDGALYVSNRGLTAGGGEVLRIEP
jgi:streptogramin lyase